MDTISMDDVKRANARRGHCWFERGTLRFFRSRVGQVAYRGPGGTYFVSSEQFVSSNGWHAPRKYTVRLQQADGSIDTVGEFNTLTRGVAIRRAQYYADKGVPAHGQA